MQVYWNRTRKCYSIRDAATGFVIDYAASVLLSNVEFEVNEAGRQRVLATGDKNVHAWAAGYVVSYASLVDGSGLAPLGIWSYKELSVREVTYNPKKYNWFVRADKTHEPVLVVDRLHCDTVLRPKPTPRLQAWREDYWGEFNYRCRIPYDVMCEQGYAKVPTTSEYWAAYKELEQGGVVWSQPERSGGILYDMFFWMEKEVSPLCPHVMRFGHNAPWGWFDETSHFSFGFNTDADAFRAFKNYFDQMEGVKA